MQYLTVEDILFLHFRIIEEFGGSHGVRSEDRLQSVVASPSQEAFGTLLYPTVFEQAAVYIRGIITDHPFVDGNKRSAVTSAVIFLGRNGVHVDVEPIALADFAVQIAVDRLDVPHIAAWLKSHSK